MSKASQKHIEVKDRYILVHCSRWWNEMQNTHTSHIPSLTNVEVVTMATGAGFTGVQADGFNKLAPTKQKKVVLNTHI